MNSISLQSQIDRIELPSGDWKGGLAKNITFILTDNCQLACKYCYVIAKNSKKRMPFEIAQRSIDYFLANGSLFPEDSVVLEFIGGEPLIEIGLIDKIVDYFKWNAFERDHKWFSSYRISIATNGLLYDDKTVQRFIEKNKEHVGINISIDGTQRKHDSQRVFSDGRGSYEKVVRNVPLWLTQFPSGSTKVTISHDDLPFVCESVLHLCELGIKTINANLVFEDVWKSGDDEVFEDQLRRLADEFIQRALFRVHSCSLFSRTIGKPLQSLQNWCGTGRMLAIDYEGTFYPCLRFAPFSLQNKPSRPIGSISTGLNHNRIRPFLILDASVQSTAECLRCEVASGCAWCQGANYDLARTNTIFERVTFICKMHKARVRANDYFWSKLDCVKGIS